MVFYPVALLRLFYPVAGPLDKRALEGPLDKRALEWQMDKRALENKDSTKKINRVPASPKDYICTKFGQNPLKDVDSQHPSMDFDQTWYILRP
jgi:hypothetical protein